MTTDRFFGGVEGRLENLRAMLHYVNEETPAQPDLWNWLRENSSAEKDSTIQTYTSFQCSIGLLERHDDEYRSSSRGTEYIESGDPEIIYNALIDHVKGFETVLQSVENGARTKDQIQTQLRNKYPDYKLPQAVVGRHLEWLLAIGVIEQYDDNFLLTAFGFRLAENLEDGRWIATKTAPDTDKESHHDTNRREELSKLRTQAERDASSSASVSIDTREVAEYERSKDIRDYVKYRADGTCEGCQEPAPFESRTGNPYLQAHHIHEVSGGGSDRPETVIALCPNCHFRVHHGKDGEAYNRELAHRLTEIEETSIEDVLEID